MYDNRTESAKTLLFHEMDYYPFLNKIQNIQRFEDHLCFFLHPDLFPHLNILFLKIYFVVRSTFFKFFK